MRGRVHLDNLEQLQVVWMRRAVSHLCASPSAAPPALDSPRSLHACALCGVDPTTDLALLTLQQHFEWVVNSSCVNESALSGVGAREALDACRDVGIVTGSVQQKMSAYRNYMHHEALRAEALARAQKVRRRLIAGEISGQQWGTHVERENGRSSLAQSAVRRPPAPDTTPGAPSAACSSAGAAAASLEERGGTQWTSAGMTTRPSVHGADRRSTERKPLENLLIDSERSGATFANNCPGKAVPKESTLETMGAATRTAVVKTSEKGLLMQEKDAPLAPLISSREQGEIFYYYCANARAEGWPSERSKPSNDLGIDAACSDH